MLSLVNNEEVKAARAIKEYVNNELDAVYPFLGNRFIAEDKSMVFDSFKSRGLTYVDIVVTDNARNRVIVTSFRYKKGNIQIGLTDVYGEDDYYELNQRNFWLAIGLINFS